MRKVKMITLTGGVSKYISLNSKRYSYFAGNNYLGLANRPHVRKTAIQSIKKFGVNFAASRCTTGTAVIYLEIENQLLNAKYYETPAKFHLAITGFFRK